MSSTNDYSGIALSYVVPAYFNQGQSPFLADLLRHYAGYEHDLMRRIQFVVVDDGSPCAVTIPDDIDLNILLLRIREDIPWNQPGARNLGIMYARSEKIFLTDLDHEVPEGTLRKMVELRLPQRTIYKMRRLNPDGTKRRSHPNTFLLARSRFLQFYGYDEDFCGHYGYDDAMFWRWQRYNGTLFRHLPRDCYVQLRAIKEAKIYHSLQRDLEHNKGIAAAKRRLWAQYGPGAGHSRRFLCFHWDIILDRQKTGPIPQPVPNRWWTKTWLWRQIF